MAVANSCTGRTLTLNDLLTRVVLQQESCNQKQVVLKLFFYLQLQNLNTYDNHIQLQVIAKEKEEDAKARPELYYWQRKSSRSLN